MSSVLRQTVGELESAGLTCAQIARQLGVAPTTVAYHLKKLEEECGAPRSERRQEVIMAVRSQVSTREAVDLLLKYGMTRIEIARRLGLSKATISSLALHHVNGVRDDNRIENLQLLCPNCHSQTDTFAGRNGRALGEEGVRRSSGMDAPG